MRVRTRVRMLVGRPRWGTWMWKALVPSTGRDYTALTMRTRRRQPGDGALLALLVLAFAWALVPLVAHAQRPVGPVIEVAHVDGVINVAMARYAVRAIEQAERRDAQLLVFTLDTPGGYDQSMREIVQRMLGANVPVVVFV